METTSTVVAVPTAPTIGKGMSTTTKVIIFIVIVVILLAILAGIFYWKFENPLNIQDADEQ